MIPWHTFATQQPELAQRGARRLADYAEGLAFLSTPRLRQPPLVQPTFPIFCSGSLYVLRSPNLQRGDVPVAEEAFALQAFPLGGRQAGGFYLAGSAVLVTCPLAIDRLTPLVRYPGQEGDKFFELLITWALFSGWARGGRGELRAIRMQWHAEYQSARGGS